MGSTRGILHSDLNCYYASVEAMLDPSLRGKAVAVCGSTEDRHGIVLAKSELAKKAGIKTGMVNWEARKLCKNLIVVPPQYDEYLKYSRLTRAIYQRYTPLVEPYGMDECWLDVSQSGLMGAPLEIAEQIRKAVREELGLTVSIGVSFNKVFAKLGSDMKKPDAITTITEDNFREKVWPLPASDLLYCGPATTRKLAKYGVHTIGDLAKTDVDFIRRLLGVNGVALWVYANGFDNSRVMPQDFVSPIKSVGHGITCTADLKNKEEVKKVIYELCQDVGHRLRVHELTARGVQLWIRGNDLFGQQYQTPLPFMTQLPSDIAAAAFKLFTESYTWSTDVRAVTVRAINLVPQTTDQQLSVFWNAERQEKRERLQDAIEVIRERFGKDSMTYALLLGDKKMPGDGREKVRMPGMMYQ